MKSILALLVVLASTSAFADGLRCEGQGYRVLLNTAVPAADRNAPVLTVIDDDSDVTIAVRQKDLITKDMRSATIYQGLANSQADGHFAFAKLSVMKQPREGSEAGSYPGDLVLNSEHERIRAELICDKER